MSIITKEIKPFLKNKIFLMIATKASQSEKTVLTLKKEIMSNTHVAPHMLTKWLDNTRQPELGQVAVIAQVLECSIEDLIEYEQPEPKAEDNQ
jgi:DNA-binding Xre family transcriptional regulator